MKKYLQEIAFVQMPLSFITIIVSVILFVFCGGIYMFNQGGCLAPDLVFGILCIILICASLSLIIIDIFPLKKNLRPKSIAVLVVNAIIAAVSIAMIIYLLIVSVLYGLLLIPSALTSINVLITLSVKLKRGEEGNEQD